MIFRHKQETRAQRIKRAGQRQYLTFVYWHGALTAAIGGM